MKKIPMWLKISFVFGVLIALKFLFFSKKTGSDVAKQKGDKSAPLSVNYYVVKTMNLEKKVFSSGKIGAFNEIEVKSEINGKIIDLYFEEGKKVSKGSLLFKINDVDLQAQLNKLSIQIKLLEQKLTRLKQLLTIKGVSEEEYEVLENEINVLKAEQNLINIQIDKTAIKAPFDGVVGLRNVSKGAIINASDVLTTLVQLSPLYIEFSVPEKYINTVSTGLTITFTTDSEVGKKEYPAKVYAIQPKIDENTKTLRIRAVYEGNTLFYPGSFVKVYLTLNTTPNALLVPTQAIVPILKGQKVFVSKNGLATEVNVTTGMRMDKMIEVINGLSVGDTVLTNGLMSVKPGKKLILLKTEN